MLNFTLTITAAPELLAAISNFTGAITSAKVVTVPEKSMSFVPLQTVSNQPKPLNSIPQQAHQVNTYPRQDSAALQTSQNQQAIQTQLPTSVIPMGNQLNSDPVSQVQVQQPSADNVQLNQQAAVNSGQTQLNAAVQNPSNNFSAVPVSTQVYTKDQLAMAATQLVDAGRRIELLNLLSTFGIQALQALPKERYGEFAVKLRALGAKI